MAKPITRMNKPVSRSALFASDPAFLYDHFNKKLPASYLRSTDKLANPSKLKSSVKRKKVGKKAKLDVSDKKVANKNLSTPNAEVKAELPKSKLEAKAKLKAKKIQKSRKKKIGTSPKLELKKSRKAKASSKSTKPKSDSRKGRSKVKKEEDVSKLAAKAITSKSKKTRVATKSIVISTKKTSRKQMKEEGQISKFASWLQKLDAPQDPSEAKKSKIVYKKPERSKIKNSEKKAKATKQKRKSVRKSKNIETSIKLSEDIISETLADLLAKQGHTDAAREMYEKLSLINPKKSGLFASKIEKLLK